MGCSGDLHVPFIRKYVRRLKVSFRKMKRNSFKINMLSIYRLMLIIKHVSPDCFLCLLYSSTTQSPAEVIFHSKLAISKPFSTIQLSKIGKYYIIYPELFIGDCWVIKAAFAVFGQFKRIISCLSACQILPSTRRSFRIYRILIVRA